MSKVMRAIVVVVGAGLITPAMAWDNTNTGSGQIVDGGSGAQSSSKAASRASARSHSSARASGGSGGAASVVNNLSGVTGGGGGYGGRAPDVVLPSIGGGGMDCPTVGFGAGGSGLGGGGGFGPSWISPDCNTRKLAEELSAMGYRREAIKLLRGHFPEVDKAFADEPAAAQAESFQPSSWCASASLAERRRNKASCGDSQ